MLTRNAIACSILLASCAVGCNELSGFASLEKSDCAGGVCDGTGGSTATSTGAGGAGQGGSGGAAAGLSNPIAIVSGRHGSCATSEDDGMARCWGEMAGAGDAGVVSRPVLIEGHQATSVVLGFSHRCLLDDIGDVYCWGNNDFGQLGDGTNETRLVPTQVVGLSGVTKLSSGANHMCAKTDAPAHFCWGNNAYGQLGNGDTLDRNVPTPMVNVVDTSHFGTGAFHGCTVLTSEELVCWGLNDSGQLGLDPTMTAMLPTPQVIAGVPNLEKVYPGGRHTCARTPTVRQLLCWGANDFGQVGDDTTTTTFTPTVIPAIQRLGVAYPGLRHTCATDSSMDPIIQLYCWGANDHGQLGIPMQPMALTPQLVSDTLLSTGFAAAKTSEHTCYITGDEQVVCAGLNDTGQLGDGTLTSRDTFAPVQF